MTRIFHHHTVFHLECCASSQLDVSLLQMCLVLYLQWRWKPCVVVYVLVFSVRCVMSIFFLSNFFSVLLSNKVGETNFMLCQQRSRLSCVVLWDIKENARLLSVDSVNRDCYVHRGMGDIPTLRPSARLLWNAWLQLSAQVVHGRHGEKLVDVWLELWLDWKTAGQILHKILP